MATGGNTTQPSVDVEKKAHDFLFSDELLKKNGELAKHFSLKEKAQDDLANAENAVVFKEISVLEFIDTVKRIAVLNKNSSVDFLDALADIFLFPLNEYFNGEPKRLLGKSKPVSPNPAKPAPSVVVRATLPRPRESVMVEKSAPSAKPAVLRESLPRPKEEAAPKVPSSKLQVPSSPVDPRAAKIADAVIAEIGLGDANLEKNLREIAIARVAGLKDDLETKAMLKRSVNTGGVGLEDSLAETLLGMIKTKAGMIPKTENQESRIKNQDLPTQSAPPDEPKLAGFVAPVASSRVEQKSAPVVQPPKLTTDWLHTEEPKIQNQESRIKNQESPEKKPADFVDPKETVKTLQTTNYSSSLNLRAEGKPQPISDLPRPIANNETLVEQILSGVQFPFKDDVQRTRFINAVKNRIRDIRDKFETQELLQRSENLGGVGLSESVAVQAVSVIEKIVSEQNRRQSLAKKEELQTFDAQTKAASTQRMQARIDQTAEAQDTRYKNLVTEKIKNNLDRPLGFLRKKEVPTIETFEIKVPRKESTRMTVPLPTQDEPRTMRPKMEDIKFSPTLVGPIEELKNFTLKDWRTLGGKSSVIIQKLSVLRNESYTKYVTALQSFKESPLFVLVQEILFESLDKNMPLSSLIELRRQENKPYLSEGEIGDIMKVE